MMVSPALMPDLAALPDTPCAAKQYKAEQAVQCVTEEGAGVDDGVTRLDARLDCIA